MKIKFMYELYDKNGNFICYRITKRIKNEQEKYDVLTARSKKSEKECRKIMYTRIFKNYKLCEIHEDDYQRFLNQYVRKSNTMVSKLRMTLRRIM